MIARLGAWRHGVSAVALNHPRHTLLAATAVGLACADLGTPLALAIALAISVTARVMPLVPAGPRAATVAVLVLGATALGHARVADLDRSHLGPRIGTVVSGDAIVLTGPRGDGHGGRRAVVTWEGERVLLRFPPWRAPTSAAIGDVVRVRGMLRAPDRTAMALDAHATLRATTAERTGRRRRGLLGIVDGIRRRARAVYGAALPAEESALLAGMALGQDEDLSDEVRADFRTAGLTHLVAASGANVTLLVALALGACMLFGVGFRARWAVALVLIIIYVPLAGGAAPVQRAGAVGVATVVATLAGRPSSRWYAVLLSLVATLAFDPRSTTAVGWQLSFAAVTGIALLAGPVRERLMTRRVPGLLAEATGVTVAATLVTAPILALHFGRVSLVALPANVLAAPAVPVVMWIGMLAAALGQAAPALGALVAGFAALPLGFLLRLGHAAARLPGAEVSGSPGVLAVVTLLAGVLAAGAAAQLRMRGGVSAWSPSTRRVVVPLVAAFIAGAVVVVPRVAGRAAVPPPGPGELRVTALDIGQGDATLLQVAGHAVLVDAGPPDSPIVPELRRAGVRRLDALVVTHPQADHDGGAPAVLEQIPVALLVDGRDGDRSPTSRAIDAPLRRRDTRVVRAEAGQEVSAGPLALRILWPPPGSAPPGTDPNDRAIVAIAEAYGSRALLTADAESPVLASLDLDPVDVLKVSHHGSADEGLPALLERLRPRLALVEVGLHNTYGHPAPATMQALRAGVPAVHRTDEEGTVRVDLAGGAVRDVVAG